MHRFICSLLLMISAHVYSSALQWDVSPKIYSNAMTLNIEQEEKPGDIIFEDRLYDIVLDDQGFIYVTGATAIALFSEQNDEVATNQVDWKIPPISDYVYRDGMHSGITSDIYVAKFTPQGEMIWHTLLGGAGEDWGKSIQLDAQGNIFVAGFSRADWGNNPRHSFTEGIFNEDEITIIKLDPSGNMLWHGFWGSSQEDWAEAIEIDPQGDIYVLFNSYATWGTPQSEFIPSKTSRPTTNIGLAKVTGDGNLQWHLFLGDENNDLGNDLLLNEQQNLIIAGSKETLLNDSLHQDLSIIQLDTTGAILWQKSFGGEKNDEANAIIENYQQLIVAGSCHSSWGTPLRSFTHAVDGNGWESGDQCIVSLTQQGELIWHTFLGGDGHDFVNTVDTFANGDILLLGESNHSWGNPEHSFKQSEDDYGRLGMNISLTRLDANGNLIWNSFWGFENSQHVWGADIDVQNNVFFAGDKMNYTATLFKWNFAIDAQTSIYMTNITDKIYLATPKLTELANNNNQYTGNYAGLVDSSSKLTILRHDNSEIELSKGSLFQWNADANTLNLINGTAQIRYSCEFPTTLSLQSMGNRFALAACDNIQQFSQLTLETDNKNQIASLILDEASSIDLLNINNKLESSDEKHYQWQRVYPAIDWILPINNSSVSANSTIQLMWTAQDQADFYAIEYAESEQMLTLGYRQSATNFLLISADDLEYYQGIAIANFNLPQVDSAQQLYLRVTPLNQSHQALSEVVASRILSVLLLPGIP